MHIFYMVQYLSARKCCSYQYQVDINILNILAPAIWFEASFIDISNQSIGTKQKLIF